MNRSPRRRSPDDGSTRQPLCAGMIRSEEEDHPRRGGGSGGMDECERDSSSRRGMQSLGSGAAIAGAVQEGGMVGNSARKPCG